MEQCRACAQTPGGTPAPTTPAGTSSPRSSNCLPEYSADLPLWGECGAIAWQRTKFSPQLLDRLAAWQQDFDDNFHWDKGWRSAETRDRWARQAEELAASVRAELGNRARLTVRLWPLPTND